MDRGNRYGNRRNGGRGEAVKIYYYSRAFSPVLNVFPFDESAIVFFEWMGGGGGQIVWSDRKMGKVVRLEWMEKGGKERENGTFFEVTVVFKVLFE